MRVSIFLDAPHQQKYVGVIREALADVPADVDATGPGTVQGGGQTPSRDRLKRWLGADASRVSQRLYERFRIALGRSLFYLLISDARWRQYVERHVFSSRPNHIILLEDNAQGLPGIVAQMAREKGVPFSILPDYIPNPAEPARFFYSNPSHSSDSWTARALLRFLPQWSYQHEGKRLLRLPVKQIVIKLLRKQECPQPWILNSGYCEAIYLESQAMKDHYRQLGFIEGKLRVVGGAMEDRLYDVSSHRDILRRKLFERYGFDSDRPLIVCGFPPNQYVSSTETFEYDSYQDLCEAWFDELNCGAREANIVVVRHPRTSTEKLTPYLRANVVLADQPIEEILPLGDIYIACVSTTIRSALALAIPTINYDCYRYAYGDFSRAKAIREVDCRDSFRAVLEELLQEQNLRALKAAALSESMYWGIIDGGFKARLREAILNVNRKYTGTPTATHQASFKL